MLYEEFVKTLEWFITPKENNLTNHIHAKDVFNWFEDKFTN